MMKKTNKRIIIIFIAITIGVGLGILIFRYISPTENRNLNEKDNIIEAFNEINIIYDNENLDETSGFQHSKNNNLTCYQYKGPKKSEYINKIKDFYITPFDEYGYLNVIRDEKNEEQLYVCLPNNCNAQTMKDYEISSETEDTRFITIGKINSTMKKDKGQWKFLFPLVICEE